MSEGRTLLIAALFLIVCGVFYRRLADYAQRRSGHSDKTKAVGIALMRPLIFLLAAMALVFAYMFFTGRA